jgi:hypothetical protein
MATWEAQLKGTALYKAAAKESKLTTSKFYLLVTAAISDLERRIIALGG